MHAGWQPVSVSFAVDELVERGEGDEAYMRPYDKGTISYSPRSFGYRVYYARPGLMNLVRAGPSVAAVGTTVTVRVVAGGFDQGDAASAEVWILDDQGNVSPHATRATDDAGGVIPARVVEFDPANAKRCRALEIEMNLADDMPVGVYGIEVKCGDVQVAEYDSGSAVGERWQGPNGGLVVERAMNAVRIEWFDMEGVQVDGVPSVPASLLDQVAAEEETYEGSWYLARITDTTEDAPSVEATLRSVDAEADYRVKASRTVTFASEGGNVYAGPKVIPYHGRLAYGTERYFEDAGYILMPSTVLIVHYESAVREFGLFRLFLDVNRDGKLGPEDSGYRPGFQLDTQVLQHDPFQAQHMWLVVRPPPKWVNSVTFSLENVSNHRGVCTNFLFIATGNGVDSGPVAVTDRRALVDLYCRDFGGKCEVVLEYTTKDGQTRKARLPIPDDEDGDGMADGWENAQLISLKFGGHVPQDATIADVGAGWDEELAVDSWSNKNRGDALPAVDEYRGFIIEDNHVRTRLSEQDVFIHKVSLVFEGQERTIDGPAPNEIWSELRYRLHILRSDEYETSPGSSYRRVNRNSLVAAGPFQYCVILKVVNEDPETVGEKPQTLSRIYPTGIARGTPADVEIIKFFVNEYSLGRYPAWPGYSPITGYKAVWRKKASKHELGHALYLDHGADEEPAGPGVSQTNHTMNCIMRSKAYQLVPDWKGFCDQNCTIETKVK